MSRVIVVGAGVVGAATGQGMAEHGHQVMFVDVNLDRLNELADQGFETATPEQLTLEDGDIVFVSVTALTGPEGIDLSHLVTATRSLGRAVAACDGHPVIVYRCTMPPGTMRTLLIPLLESRSGKRADADFGVVYNPEYLRAESARSDFLHPRLITLATLRQDDEAHRRLVLLLAPFGAPLTWLSLEAAEFQKYVNNVGNAIKVSTYNWFRTYGLQIGLSRAQIQEAFLASVASAEGLWNPAYGTRDAGAYGGACLPKDIKAMIHHAREVGLDPVMLDAAELVNARMSELDVRGDNVVIDLAARARAGHA